jgi:hypothetical protein
MHRYRHHHENNSRMRLCVSLKELAIVVATIGGLGPRTRGLALEFIAH